MKRLLVTGGLILVFSLMATSVAWAQGEGEASAGTVVSLLAPLLAAATAIERIIEMIFDWYESIILNAGSLIGQGKSYLGWARDQVNKWRHAIEWDRLSGDALREAEDALEEAQERLISYLKSPLYTSRKRGLTLGLGIVLALIIAFLTQLRMFSLLGIELSWPWIDTFITGLIIGTGSAPVHSLIGLLQNTKNAVDQARALWSGRAYSQALDAELKRLGMNAELKTLKELQKQMQDSLNALRERVEVSAPMRTVSEPSLATSALDAEQARAWSEAVKGLAKQSMGRAELNRRVRRILR